ncbi:MAG: AsmA family protein, partial [Alphaproteobacteria bacterium]
MRRIAIAAGALVALVIIALLVGPFFFDWNRFKPEVTERVASATGYRLEIAGDLSLRLLPAPALVARDLTLHGAAAPGGDSTQPLAAMKALQLSLVWSDLLAGRIAIDRVVLVEPDIQLVALPSGGGNWLPEETARARDAAAGGLSGDGAAAERSGPALSIAGFAVEDGRVSYVNGATSLVAQAIDISGSLDSLVGPVTVNGDLQLNGETLDIRLMVGGLADSAIPVQARFATSSAEVRLDGAIHGLDSVTPAYRGSLAVNARSSADGIAQLLALAGVTPPTLGGLDDPLSLSADMAGDAAGITLNSVQFEVDGTRGTGAVLVALGSPAQVDVALSLDRINGDSVLASIISATRIRSDESASGGSSGSVSGGGQTGSMAHGPFAGLGDLPVTGSLSLTIGSMSWRDGLVSDIALDAALRPGGLQVSRVSLRLPGEAVLNTKGSVTARDGVAMDVQVQAANLQATLAWLGVDRASLPAHGFRSARLASTIRYDGTQLALDGMTGAIDGTALSGTARIDLSGARPLVDLTAEFGTLNLNDYIGDRGSGGDAAAAAVRQDAESRQASPSGVLLVPAMAPLPADLAAEIRVQRLVVGDVALTDLSLSASADSQMVTITTLQTEIPGGRLSASGQIAGLGPTPTGQATFSVASSDPAALLAGLGVTPTPGIQQAGRMDLSGAVRLDSAAVEGLMTLTLGQGSATVDGRIGDLAAMRDIAVSVVATHPNLPTLLAGGKGQAGPGQAARLTAQMSGDATALTFTTLSFALADNVIDGSGEVRLPAGGRPDVRLDLTGGTLNLNQLTSASQGSARGATSGGGNSATAGAGGAPWSDDPVIPQWLNAVDGRLSARLQGLIYGQILIEQPAVMARLADGALTIESLTGTVFDGTVSASGRLSAGRNPGVAADVTLDGLQVRDA